MDAEKYAALLRKQINAQKISSKKRQGGGTRDMFKDLKKDNTFGTGVTYDK